MSLEYACHAILGCTDMDTNMPYILVSQMPSPTVEQFVEAVKANVFANKCWVKYYVKQM